MPGQHDEVTDDPTTEDLTTDEPADRALVEYLGRRSHHF